MCHWGWWAALGAHKKQAHRSHAKTNPPIHPSFTPPPLPHPQKVDGGHPIPYQRACDVHSAARRPSTNHDFLGKCGGCFFVQGQFWNLWYQIWGKANKSEIFPGHGDVTQWGQHVYDTCPAQHDTGTGTGTGTGAPLPCGSVGPPFGATDTPCVHAHARANTAGRHSGSTRRVRVPLVLPPNFSGGM